MVYVLLNVGMNFWGWGGKMSNYCLVCEKQKPPYRNKYLTCSKKCSNAWIWFNARERNQRKRKAGLLGKYGK